MVRGLGTLLKTHRPTMLIEILEPPIAIEIETIIAGCDYQIYRIHEERGVERMTQVTASAEEGSYNTLLIDAGRAAAIGLAELGIA